MRKILVIEDDEATRLVVDTILSEAGYEVTLAANGAAALAVLETWSPDLILLDLMMPVMDGYAFRQAQLARSDLNTIPVVVFSSSANLAAVPSAFDARAMVAKPLDVDVLLAVVQRLIGEPA